MKYALVIIIVAILVGGASIDRATNLQALVGTFLFHSLFITAQSAASNLFGDSAVGEYFRAFLSYGVIAVALMTCSDNEHLVDYTGDSFRDLTRIANINDLMWSELFMLNRDSLLKYMDIFLDEFASLRDMIRDGRVDELRAKCA